MTDDIGRDYHDNPQAPPGPHTLPKPPSRLLKDGTTLSIKDVYLGDIGDHDKLWMPLYVMRLRKSYFYEIATNEQLGAALRLWMAAWIAKPAASLKDEDRYLAKVAGYDIRDQHWLQHWSQVRDSVLHGWIRCSDGRIYHLDLAKIALEQAEKLKMQQKSAANARAKVGKTRKKVLRQRQELNPEQRQVLKQELAQALYKDRDLDIRNPPTPQGGARGFPPDAPQSANQTPPRQADRPKGLPTVERDPRPTSPPQASRDARSRAIDPEAQATRAAVYIDATLKDLGYTLESLTDALWAACADNESKLEKRSPSLQVVQPILDLVRDIPGLSIREDVLPAIRAKIARYQGEPIGSWRFFGSAIRGWHQNRVSGAGNGGKAKVYDPETIPPWWGGRDEGVPPPGWGSHLTKPWKQQVIDERTGEPRRYGGRWDWEWLDAVERFQRDGTWHEWFAAELPGRPGSSCPDDICAHFGIVPQARQPNVVVPLVVGKMPLPTRRAYVPPPEVFARRATQMTNGSEKPMGDVPSQAAGHSVEGDEAPPF